MAFRPFKSAKLRAIDCTFEERVNQCLIGNLCCTTVLCWFRFWRVIWTWITRRPWRVTTMRRPVRRFGPDYRWFLKIRLTFVLCGPVNEFNFILGLKVTMTSLWSLYKWSSHCSCLNSAKSLCPWLDLLSIYFWLKYFFVTMNSHHQKLLCE